MGMPLPQPAAWHGGGALGGAVAAEEGGKEGRELDWGPEGEEAPLLATGRVPAKVLAVQYARLWAECY